MSLCTFCTDSVGGSQCIRWGCAAFELQLAVAECIQHCQQCLETICKFCLQIGNWDVEADDEIPHASLISGSAFHSASSATVPPTTATLARATSALPAQPAKRFKAVTKAGAACAATPAATSADVNAVPLGAHLLHEAEPGGRAVYIDASLARHLRPHQIEGVTFLYNVRHALNNDTKIMLLFNFEGFAPLT